jgi:hypothetical protein
MLMGTDEESNRAEPDVELEREIRKGRKFTLAEAIGRLAGAGALKGESPVACNRPRWRSSPGWKVTWRAAEEHWESCRIATSKGASSC